MIDGLYIRRALKDGTPNAASAISLVEDYLETRLSSPSQTGSKRTPGGQ